MAIAISRRSNVEPFHAMDILAEANRLRGEGRSIISMAVGQPSDPAPLAVRGAARRALDDGRIGYTDSLGLRALREAIADHYSEHYGISIPWQRVVVTTGSSAGFNLAFMAMFDPGDRVGIAAPGYPAYRNIMAALGLEVVEIELDGEASPRREDARRTRTHPRHAGPVEGYDRASEQEPGELKCDLPRHLGASRDGAG